MKGFALSLAAGVASLVVVFFGYAVWGSPGAVAGLLLVPAVATGILHHILMRRGYGRDVLGTLCALAFLLLAAWEGFGILLLALLLFGSVGPVYSPKSRLLDVSALVLLAGTAGAVLAITWRLSNRMRDTLAHTPRALPGAGRSSGSLSTRCLRCGTNYPSAYYFEVPGGPCRSCAALAHESKGAG
jgi:hypothetical protein